MAIGLGSFTPSKLYLGMTEVTKAYFGAGVAYDLAPVSGGWDISTATFVRQGGSISATNNVPSDLFFSEDGSQVYVAHTSARELEHYSLSAPWDISTLSLVYERYVQSEDNAPGDMFFKPDGTAFYWCGGIDDAIFKYSGGNPWTLFGSKVDTFLLSGNGLESPRSVFFNPEGTAMFVIASDGTSVNLYQFNLPNAWEFSNVSTPQAASLAPQATSPVDMYFKPDGSKLFVLCNATQAVHEWNLSTPWDISTLSYVQSFDVSAQETSPLGIYFKPDGSKMYIIGSSQDAIIEYDIEGGAPAEWTPAELGASLDLWLDADDASTITLNGSTVSQWDDKSGNGYHFAQGTAADQPAYSTGVLNGKNVINFASTDSLARAAIPFNDLGNNSLYVVGNRTGRAGTFNVALILARASRRTRSILFDFSSAEIGRWGSYTNQPIPSPAGFVDATYKICEMIADQDTNSYQFYQGGTSQGSNGVVNSTTGFSSSSCFIGNDQFNSWLEGNIAEVIFCDEKNSDADRQKIEGYLAWKWGLEADLPADHPYKSAPPTV